MSIMSMLVNKVTAFAGLEDSTVTTGLSTAKILFIGLTVFLILQGILTIVNRRPYWQKFEKYTDASVNAASVVLGVSNLLQAAMIFTLGVLDMNALPKALLFSLVGVSIAAFIAVTTVFYGRLQKKPL